MKNFVIGIGEVLWDMLPEGKKLGGAPANFAYHVSQFGLESSVVSSVGRDALGNEIMDILRSKNLDRHVSEVDYPTGTVQVTLDSAGVPCYKIKEGVQHTRQTSVWRIGEQKHGRNPGPYCKTKQVPWNALRNRY